MKKIISLILVAVMLLATVAFVSCGKTDAPVDTNTDKADDATTPAEKITLKVYTEAGFAPYEYVDEKGKVVGVDIDVMNYIAEKLGYNIIINDIDFNAILNEVEKDEYAVGAAGMSKTDARDEVALASVVYAESVQYVIAPAGTFSKDSVSIEDVVEYAAAQGKAIGVQEGTTGADMVDAAIAESSVQTAEYPNAIVASGDIGTTLAAVVIDKLPAKSICADKDALECWKIDTDAESYVLYFNKNATKLVEKVNEILTAMIADGTIDQFTENHSN